MSVSSHSDISRQNLKVQKIIVMISLGLFLVKIFAWWLTNSVAILTDALESTVNVIAGFMGLYSLNLSAKPKDKEHPYGHGKVEFITAAIEGALITVAGILIIREAVMNLFSEHPFQKIDWGLYLISATALINYFAGLVCVRTGTRNHSPALISGGKHLISDTYTTLGIIVGLVLLYITGIAWIDAAVAILFACIILYTGYRIIRKSLAGMMDEADTELIENLVDLLNKNRSDNWVDLHNLRIIQYGSQIHMDCHLTVPWYLNVHEAHRQIDALSGLVKQHFGDRVELFVHTDGCLEFSCAICEKSTCSQRQHPFQQKMIWTIDNIVSDQKHRVQS